MTSHKMMSSVIYNNDLLLYRSSLSFMVSTLSSSLLVSSSSSPMKYITLNCYLLLVTSYLFFFCTFYLFFELISLSFLLLYKQNTDQLNTFLYDFAKLRAVRGSCPTCSRALRALVDYVSRVLHALVPHVPYVLSYLTCLVLYMLLCFTCLVLYMPSAQRFMSPFSLRTLLSRILSTLCPNVTFNVLEFPCIALLFFYLFANCDFIWEMQFPSNTLKCRLVFVNSMTYLKPNTKTYMYETAGEGEFKARYNNHKKLSTPH